MPIQWSRPFHKADKLFFVSCPPNQIVHYLARPQELHVLPLHWLEDRNGSFPCFDECPHCAQGVERRLCCYAPVLVLGKKAGRWYNAILSVGDPTSTLAVEDFQGQSIVVGRPRQPDDSLRMVYYGAAKDVPVPLPHIKGSFDVRPFLLRRWGLYKEADLIGCELHTPPQDAAAHERAG